MALAVSVGGQLAIRAAEEPPSRVCPLSRGAAFERFSHRPPARLEERGLAQRVALAVVSAVLHGWS